MRSFCCAFSLCRPSSSNSGKTILLFLLRTLLTSLRGKSFSLRTILSSTLLSLLFSLALILRLGLTSIEGGSYFPTCSFFLVTLLRMANRVLGGRSISCVSTSTLTHDIDDWRAALFSSIGDVVKEISPQSHPSRAPSRRQPLRDWSNSLSFFVQICKKSYVGPVLCLKFVNSHSQQTNSIQIKNKAL